MGQALSVCFGWLVFALLRVGVGDRRVHICVQAHMHRCIGYASWPANPGDAPSLSSKAGLQVQAIVLRFLGMELRSHASTRSTILTESPVSFSVTWCC